MSLVTIVITLIVVGVLLWLVNTYIPMDGKIKKVLNIVVDGGSRPLAAECIRRVGPRAGRSGHNADAVPGRADLLCHLPVLSANMSC